MLALALAAYPSPARAQNAKLSITSPLPIILGEVDTVSLVIELPETPDTEGRPLQVTSNVGTLDTPERVGPGKYRVHYKLPTTKYPQAAIIAAWRETGPDARVDFMRIPLSARTKLPVKAGPITSVRAMIGDDSFGPVIADRSGQALVPIVVPPGVREVTVETSERSGKKRSMVPVKVPPYNRLAMAVTPYTTDGKLPVTVHVYYDDERNPPSVDNVHVAAKGGTVTPLGTSGAPNRYRFRYQTGYTLGDVSLSASVSGDDTSNAHTNLLMAAPVPERMLSRTSSTTIAANGTSTKVLRALFMDHYGLGVPGLTVRATASDGQLSAVRDAGNGNYEVTLTAPATVPRGRKVTVELSASTGRGATVAGRIEIPTMPSSGAASGLAKVGGGEKPAEGTQLVTTPSEPSTGSKPKVFAVGARFGGSYDAQVAPLLGLELSVRPKLSEQRKLAFFLSVEFRTMSHEFSSPEVSKIDSTLTRLPVMVGLTYDVVQKSDWRGYLGAGGGVVGLAHRIETDFQDPQVFRRIAPVAEVLGGVAYSGLFLEVAGTYMSLSDRSLELPAIGVSASLGYRLGLF